MRGHWFIRNHMVRDVDKCKVGEVWEVVDQHGESIERGIAIIQFKFFDMWLTILDEDEFGVVEIYCS